MNRGRLADRLIAALAAALIVVIVAALISDVRRLQRQLANVESPVAVEARDGQAHGVMLDRGLHIILIAAVSAATVAVVLGIRTQLSVLYIARKRLAHTQNLLASIRQFKVVSFEADESGTITGVYVWIGNAADRDSALKQAMDALGICGIDRESCSVIKIKSIQDLGE